MVNAVRISKQNVLRADVVNISLRMQVAASRSVVGSSDVLVVEQYGNPQEGLQFVSPWSVGFRMQWRLHFRRTGATPRLNGRFAVE